MFIRTFAAAVVGVLAFTGSFAADDEPVRRLLSTGVSVVGEPIQYPASSPAHVTAVIITLAPGARTPVHRHGVPLFAHILQGELTVDYRGRGTRTYRPGDTFMEAMSVAHYGANNGAEPVRILAVYLGAEGAEEVVAEK